MRQQFFCRIISNCVGEYAIVGRIWLSRSKEKKEVENSSATPLLQLFPFSLLLLLSLRRNAYVNVGA